MKKFIIVLVILLGFNMSYSQGDKFQFPLMRNSDGSQSVTFSNTYVVLHKEGTAEELYFTTKNWINENYKNPEDVIISNTEKEFLKMQGSGIPILGRDKYYISFKFKDGKIRMEIESVEIYYSGYGYVSGGWTPLSYKIRNSSGKLKDKNWRTFSSCRDYFDELAISLVAYSNVSADDGW